MKKAVLDIGSNTIRLLIADISTRRHIKRLHYEHRIVRLGENLNHTGKLGQPGINRALNALQYMVQICHKHQIKVAAIQAVATAAVREAGNGTAFIAQVYQQTGLRIHIISGHQEAALALAGARLGLPEHIGCDMLLFDIGGGSTEFTRVVRGKVLDSHSLKLGVVRLYEQYDDYTALKQAALPFLDTIESYWQQQIRPTHWVGTAGTVTTLAAIAQNLQSYEPQRINGYMLDKPTFDKLRQQLLNMTPEERLRIPMLEKGREDVIIAGIAIIDAMFERWRYPKLISVDYGLLEGMLLQPRVCSR